MKKFGLVAIALVAVTLHLRSVRLPESLFEGGTTERGWVDKYTYPLITPETHQIEGSIACGPVAVTTDRVYWTVKIEDRGRKTLEVRSEDVEHLATAKQEGSPHEVLVFFRSAAEKEMGYRSSKLFLLPETVSCIDRAISEMTMRKLRGEIRDKLR